MWQQSDVLISVTKMFTGLDVATVRCTDQLLKCLPHWMWQQSDVLISVTKMFTGLDVATVRCTEQCHYTVHWTGCGNSQMY